MTSTSMHDWTFWCTASLGIIGPDQRGWDENVTEVSCGPEEGRRAASVKTVKNTIAGCGVTARRLLDNQQSWRATVSETPFLRRGFFAVAGKKKRPRHRAGA
jgi:hypothetical protein